MGFPIFKTKIKGLTQQFNLADSKDRQVYFEKKTGKEIKKIRDYLKDNTFICHFLGKKNSGKGTYAKMFAEIVDPQKISHFSIGDMVREVHQIFLQNEKKKEKIMKFLERNFRGYISLDKAVEKLLSRGTKTLLPTEFILALIKWKISTLGRKTLFIDGFPRDLDQIAVSLFYRDLIGHRDDIDIFVLIDVPRTIIDMRMRYRVVCPKCQTPRNLRLLRTKQIGYDKKKNEFYLICDNPDCYRARMVQKEGDELGIKPIEGRLKMDEKLMEKAFSLYGIPKVLLRNSIPVDVAKAYVDEYEITPKYSYQWVKKENKVKVIEESLKIRDDKGVLSYSLLPEPVVVSLIKQLVEVLGL